MITCCRCSPVADLLINSEGQIFTMESDTSTRRRVKLYMLNEDRQWDDRGTGHVSSAYVDKLKGMALIVRSETDGEIIKKKY